MIPRRFAPILFGLILSGLDVLAGLGHLHLPGDWYR